MIIIRGIFVSKLNDLLNINWKHKLYQILVGLIMYYSFSIYAKQATKLLELQLYM